MGWFRVSDERGIHDQDAGSAIRRRGPDGQRRMSRLREARAVILRAYDLGPTPPSGCLSVCDRRHRVGGSSDARRCLMTDPRDAARGISRAGRTVRAPTGNEESGTPPGIAAAVDRAAFIETAIQVAIRRGEFDDLPGAGKPLEGLGTHHDPDWWIRRKIETENLTRPRAPGDPAAHGGPGTERSARSARSRVGCAHRRRRLQPACAGSASASFRADRPSSRHPATSTPRWPPGRSVGRRGPKAAPAERPRRRRFRVRRRS